MEALKRLWEACLTPSGLQSVLLMVVSLILSTAASWWISKLEAPKGDLRSIYEQSIVFKATSLKDYGGLEPGSQFSIQTAPLLLSDAKGQVIRTDVYSASVKIWNAGTDKVEGADIRQPYQLVLRDPSAKIISSDLVFTSSSNADRFRWNASNQTLSWDHFDPREQATINIVYTADHQVILQWMGFVVGEPRELNPGDRLRSLTTLDIGFVERCLELFIGLYLFLLVLTLLFNKSARDLKTIITSSFTASVLTVVAVIILLKAVRSVGGIVYYEQPPF